MPIRPDRAASEDAAKEAALRILGRGPRTEREVLDRLLARGFVPDAAERAVERLRRVSLLDDRAFVRSFLRSVMTRKPQGRLLLRATLKRRGIAPSLLEELDDLAAEDRDLAERHLHTEEGRARAALDQLERRARAIRGPARARKLAAALQRRGFDWSVVRDLVNEPGNEPEEDPDPR
jgi:regulatory protein